jgi:hypothetical protein
VYDVLSDSELIVFAVVSFQYVSQRALFLYPTIWKKFVDDGFVHANFISEQLKDVTCKLVMLSGGGTMDTFIQVVWALILEP